MNFSLFRNRTSWHFCWICDFAWLICFRSLLIWNWSHLLDVFSMTLSSHKFGSCQCCLVTLSVLISVMQVFKCITIDLDLHIDSCKMWFCTWTLIVVCLRFYFNLAFWYLLFRLKFHCCISCLNFYTLVSFLCSCLEYVYTIRMAISND